MKYKWPVRVYYELFSGPGKCVIRDTSEEEDGSPLQVLKYDFSRYIFTEMNMVLAKALQTRLASHPKANLCEIWCGDCSEAIDHVSIDPNALTFTFIDPTGIGHAPFSLIEKLNKKTRVDLLINIQHGMGIKMNMHQYPMADFTRSILSSSPIPRRNRSTPSLSPRMRTMKDRGRNLSLATNCSIAGLGTTFWRASIAIDSIRALIFPSPTGMRSSS